MMTKEVEGIDPALVARMVALVRTAAAWKNSVVSEGFDNRLAETANEAREIVAFLPKPVDPDLIEARRVAATIFDGHLWASAILAGKKDEDQASGVSLALAAIKRGRELAQVSA
jgi:hypothetical protein